MRSRFGLAQIKAVVLMINLELLYKPAAINLEKPDARLVVVSNRVPLPASPAAPVAGGSLTARPARSTSARIAAGTP